MRVEHLHDLPVIGHQIKKVDLSELLDEHFPDHGHWSGISGGKTTFGWLLYILSEGDHRLSHVEDWGELKQCTLSAILEEPDLRVVDFCDDRLGRLLDRFSDDDKWNRFEEALGKKVLEVYQLVEGSKNKMKVVRSDSFNAPQYRDSGELFRHGYSKQRRRDQPFCKVISAALDPLAVPLAVDIVKGSGPDSNLYLSVINRVQSMLEGNGNLYVGDSQLASMPNRLAIHLSGDYYLSPLNKKQVLLEQMNRYLDQIKIPFEELPSLFTDAKSKRKPAYFYELSEILRDDESDTEWEERRILVYSPDYAKGLVKSLEGRLTEAKEKIEKIVIAKRGRQVPKTLEDLEVKIGLIVKQYKVEDCFKITTSENKVRRKVQRHKSRPKEVREEITLELKIERNKEVIELKKKKLGWQIYGTNVPQEKLETSELVKIYRDEYRIEHLFDYMINRDVGLLPIYLKKEERVKGLIRLLSIAMKFSMLIQHSVRVELEENKEKLNGVYPGNKSRTTSHPTTAMLLRAFKGISVVWMDIQGVKTVQMVALKETQNRILQLLKIPDQYQNTLKVFETGLNLRET